MKLIILFLFVTWLLCGCTESRVKRYGDLLEPLINSAKKREVDRKLGNSAFCEQEAQYEMCEYRTASERNYTIPDVFRRQPGFGGPDLSPYELFDVLRLYYDAFGVLKEWEPVVIVQ